ncbi:IPT/TIG domain-containing protein [Tellurirhabdus rosea]|uniref:IPT/TIG domain-containing protein n=1 Tax=Tellurirhabdus rosea TaxID=2674997 RepID=UPI00224D4138|nr:IPT/TIG domain-containing protein [Tellurirhabdus rosea]
MQFLKSCRLANWPLSLLIALSLFAGLTACENDSTPDPVLSITNVSPTSAPVGSTVTITGTQFSTTPESNTVTFSGNVRAAVQSATATQLVVTVPAGAQNGPISVTSGGATVQSATAFSISARPVQEVQGDITQNTTWSKGTIYVIRGFVYVKSGAVLTIQPGTIIKGGTREQDPSGNQRGGTLIIEKGARIVADGTAQEPIVFTSNKARGQRNYGDWGGIVIIGKAPHNQAASRTFEGGIAGTFGTDNEAADNSGTLRYVRIEFPGIALSTATNSEINGLTLYGVGSGTTIENVQVSYSGDDAYEWFGGTVNAKNLVALRTFDDDFDTDFGYVGKVQYALALRDPAFADQSGSNIFESDNFNPGEPATAANNGLPLTAPVFANVSAFAFAPGTTPSTATAQGSGGYQSAMHLRRNTAISIYNSVFVGFPEGLRLDGTATGTLANATAGRLDLRGITMANVGISGSTTSIPVRGAGAITNEQALAYFSEAARNNNVVTDAATLLLPAATFNLTTPTLLPGTGSPLLQGAVTSTKLDAFFTTGAFRGAFGATNWAQGWTNFDPQNTDYN